MSPLAVAEPARVDLRLEGGSEYDSNIHRLEQEDGEATRVEGAPLLRLGARGRLSWKRRSGERLRLQAESSAKLFATPGGQDENVGVVAGEGGWERALGERAAAIGLQASYYDALGLDLAATAPVYESRNFRTGSGEAQLALGSPGGQRVTASLGYRLFHYKPNPLFDWSGERVGLGWQTTVWRGDRDASEGAASLDLAAVYRVERRGYASSARTQACPDGSPPSERCFAGTGLERVDLHHGVALEAVWTGTRVYTGRYELEVNDSNSHGESLVRQRLELAITLELTRDLYLTFEAALLYNVFLDSLLVARGVQSQTFLSIEEENRNSLTALVAWKLAPRTTMEARYAIYSNEFATAELNFRRQTFYLGLVHDLR